MSRHQLVQALRGAAIPEDEFERMVESDNPPTITALSDRGTRRDARLRRGHAQRRLSAARRALAALEPAELRTLLDEFGEGVR